MKGKDVRDFCRMLAIQMRTQAKTQVFLYGSFMDAKKLAENGLGPARCVTACLKNWAIHFSPYATMRPRRGSEVWGVMCRLGLAELDKVYGRPLFNSHRYYPEAVVVRTAAGAQISALTYISHEKAAAKPGGDYLEAILRIARQRRFPKAYVGHLQKHVVAGMTTTSRAQTK